jgi:hypothetical protein
MNWLRTAVPGLDRPWTGLRAEPRRNGTISGDGATGGEERAVAAVARCQNELRRAEAQAREAGETLRRARRSVVAAREALAEATRHLGRLALPGRRPQREQV